MLVGDFSSDSVHIGGSFLRESLTVWNGNSILGFVEHLTNEGSSFQLDEAVSDALTGGESGVLSAGSVSLLSTVVLSQGVDSDLLSHVELVGNGGSSDVKPVWVIWGKILVASGLVVNSPLWHLDSVSFFQVLGEGFNELLSWDVLNGDSHLSVDDSLLNLK